MTDDDKPERLAGVKPAQHLLSHLFPERKVTPQEQAEISRREHARRKGNRKRWWEPEPKP